jgi:hypothetical protein
MLSRLAVFVFESHLSLAPIPAISSSDEQRAYLRKLGCPGPVAIDVTGGTVAFAPSGGDIDGFGGGASSCIISTSME